MDEGIWPLRLFSSRDNALKLFMLPIFWGNETIDLILTKFQISQICQMTYGRRDLTTKVVRHEEQSFQILQVFWFRGNGTIDLIGIKKQIIQIS